jgi:hypothetical protein
MTLESALGGGSGIAHISLSSVKERKLSCLRKADRFLQLKGPQKDDFLAYRSSLALESGA